MNRLRIVCALALMIFARHAMCAENADANRESSNVPEEKPKDAHSKILSREDGWLDVSEFVDEAYGFLPIVMPITEPAIGYGAAGGLAFIDKPLGEAAAGFGRPNITVVAGMATENDTWGAAVGDLRHWMNDRVQTLAGVMQASVNLDFYGIGESSYLKDHPLTYNLEPSGGMVQARYRIGNSRVWTGLGYALATMQVSFAAPDAAVFVPSLRRETQLGGLLPSVTYDSRDNIFTPIRGAYVDLALSVFDPALGGDDSFQRVNLTAMYYVPLHSKITLGLRSILAFSFGDAPFYMRPYVALRGAPVMRYQGEQVAQIEAELRWQFWHRFSVVGFVGSGAAWNELDRFDAKQTVDAGGLGFRYEMARKYGLHMGLDLAFDGDDTAIYVQVGSAWMRP